ncbi:DUF1045 domain-containing protein [uncultured Tateyamaria sp.]|uniref:DUF1045 domain-containing protein n=1 Tax=uncultured Tateyamaria sp. TaxID=455651 RepID=UPI00345807C2
MFTRYAVYYTPAAGTPLAGFGADWLGWDSAAGVGRAHLPVDGVDLAEITATPRKYGFHATIKPPFRLAKDRTAEALSAALERLCDAAPAVALEGLKVSRLGRFLALVPVGDTEPLARLAGSVVQELDPFRAPPTEAELAKRRSARLSPAQEANLQAWGYPYVMDQFRFHMTLTGRLDATTLERAEAALAAPLAALRLSPYPINGLTLFGDDAQGMFHQIERFALRG